MAAAPPRRLCRRSRRSRPMACALLASPVGGPLPKIICRLNRRRFGIERFRFRKTLPSDGGYQCCADAAFSSVSPCGETPLRIAYALSHGGTRASPVPHTPRATSFHYVCPEIFLCSVAGHLTLRRNTHASHQPTAKNMIYVRASLIYFLNVR